MGLDDWGDASLALPARAVKESGEKLEPAINGALDLRRSWGIELGQIRFEGEVMTKQLFEQPDIYTSFPTPLALVSCADQSGKGNIITLAWVGVVSNEPPMVSIAIRRGKYSYHLIKASGEFVLNLATEELLKETDYCGTVSGKNVDKWETSNFTPVPATRVKAPLIDRSPVNLECVVRHVLHLGSHDVFLSEVVASHVDHEALTDGKLDATKVRPIVYFCRDYRGMREGTLAKRGVGMPKP